MSDETEGFFSRGGPPALSFHDNINYYAWRGIVRGGVIIAEPSLRNVVDLESKQVKTWDDGTPRKKMVVTLECPGGPLTMPDGTVVQVHDERDRSNPKDQGHRRLFIQGFMVDAVRNAIQQVGARGLSIGGRLYLAWTDEKASQDSRRKPGKLYTAIYLVPEVAVPAGGGAPPQAGLSGAPSSPFGPPGVPPPAFNYAVQEGQQQASQTVATLQQASYPGPAYAPPAAPAQQAPAAPAQQAPAVGAVAPDGSAMWNGQAWVPIPGQHVPDPPAAPFGQPPQPAPSPPAGFTNPFTGR